ncbi:MAG TPA: fused response regulator/phosphatase [Steroidobacteraceae bacterium]
MIAPEPKSAAEAEAAIAGAGATVGHIPASRRRVLLVESEEDQAIYWGAVLASLGFEVLAAPTLSAAETLLAAGPSIVACGASMADGLGIEFLAQLRQREELALVYLLLLTCSAGDEEAIASLRGGANDCIDMSASYGEIRARLELAERVISLNEALHRKNSALGDALTVIKTELQSAARLQVAMLPRPLDYHSFQIRTLYRPSDLLGGDMVGLTPPGGERIAFGLIDVAGHGTASALMSCSLIREMMDRMAALLQGADDDVWQHCGRLVIEELNGRYCRLDIPGMYFTALAGVLDARSGTVSYCQAGHPSLASFDPNSGWTELEDSGFPIGLFEHAEFASRQVRLASGQMLLAVSDGFLRPHVDDPTGSRAIMRALPRSPSCAEMVMERLDVLAGQVHGSERDDQSALLIRCIP